MRLNLIAFGKLKTPGLRITADYYLKLIRPWANLTEVELKALTVPDKSPDTRLRIQDKEGQKLLEQTEKSEIYLLEETGKAMTTQQWARLLRETEESGRGTSFCIGSGFGFSSEVREKARGRFSLGPQTLSHELARLVFLEQLYRSLSVLKGHPYHNEGS